MSLFLKNLPKEFYRAVVSSRPIFNKATSLFSSISCNAQPRLPVYPIGRIHARSICFGNTNGDDTRKELEGKRYDPSRAKKHTVAKISIKSNQSGALSSSVAHSESCEQNVETGSEGPKLTKITIPDPKRKIVPRYKKDLPLPKCDVKSLKGTWVSRKRIKLDFGGKSAKQDLASQPVRIEDSPKIKTTIKELVRKASTRQKLCIRPEKLEDICKTEVRKKECTRRSKIIEKKKRKKRKKTKKVKPLLMKKKGPEEIEETKTKVEQLKKGLIACLTPVIEETKPDTESQEDGSKSDQTECKKDAEGGPKYAPKKKVKDAKKKKEEKSEKECKPCTSRKSDTKVKKKKDEKNKVEKKPDEGKKTASKERERGTNPESSSSPEEMLKSAVNSSLVVGTVDQQFSQDEKNKKLIADLKRELADCKLRKSSTSVCFMSPKLDVTLPKPTVQEKDMLSGSRSFINSVCTGFFSTTRRLPEKVKSVPLVKEDKDPIKLIKSLECEKTLGSDRTERTEGCLKPPDRCRREVGSFSVYGEACDLEDKRKTHASVIQKKDPTCTTRGRSTSPPLCPQGQALVIERNKSSDTGSKKKKSHSKKPKAKKPPEDDKEIELHVDNSPMMQCIAMCKRNRGKKPPCEKHREPKVCKEVCRKKEELPPNKCDMLAKNQSKASVKSGKSPKQKPSCLTCQKGKKKGSALHKK